MTTDGGGKTKDFLRFVGQRLPHYSPDLNPMEAAWAQVKALVRRAMPKNVPDLETAIRRALQRVRASDALGWVKSCGSALPPF